MGTVKDKASKLKRLRDDSVFQELMEAVRLVQVNIFLDTNSTTEARDDAHDIVRALGLIDDYINTVLTDEKIFDKHNKE